MVDTDDSASSILDPPPTVDPRVTVGPLISCLDPAERAALGPYVRYELEFDWWTVGEVLRSEAKGVNVDDFDGDGELDLFVPQVGDVSKLLWGDGAGSFTDVTDLVLPEPLKDVMGATTADPDADGDADIVVYGYQSPLQLLRNDGAGLFSVEDLPSPEPGCGGTASFGDVDLDGDLDLFHGRLNGSNDQVCESVLLENTGGGSWLDVSERLPLDIHSLRVMSSAWLQFDDDPWPELYAVTDRPGEYYGNRNLAVDNDGGVLVPMSATGLEIDIAGMGLGIGDLNDDRVWDMVVPGLNEVAVLVSVPGTSAWSDNSVVYGIDPDGDDEQHWAWGAEVDDLDNDGLVDVAIGFGPKDSTTNPDYAKEPDEIYRNLGNRKFDRVAEAWGTADVMSMRGIVFTDLDHDGWLDIVKRVLAAQVIVYVSRCGEDHWIEVELDSADENLRGIGATVRVAAGELSQQRLIVAGSTGYNSSGPAVAHFGLGATDHVDTIEVTWPDGAITHHAASPADRRLTIRYAPDDSF